MNIGRKGTIIFNVCLFLSQFCFGVTQGSLAWVGICTVFFYIFAPRQQGVAL